MAKLIVSGLRTCDRKEAVFSEIQKYVSEIGGIEEIITGGSTGVSKFSRLFAEENNIKFKEFEPNWQDDLNAAGMICDARMAEYGTHLLVLSDGASKESKNLINEAKRNNLAIKTIGVFRAPADSELSVKPFVPGVYY